MRRDMLLCCICLIWAFSGLTGFTCRTLKAQGHQIRFEHFTQSDGLSAPVTNIVQDLYGFLWLGTSDGLNRFDGKNFVVYRQNPNQQQTLPNNIINALCTDHLGRIWAATNGGVCYYDFQDDAFHPISYPDTLEALDAYRVHAIIAGQDRNIWFATRTHIHEWKDNQIRQTIALPDSNLLNIKYVFEDHKNNLWIGVNSGVYVYRSGSPQLLYQKITSPFSVENNLTVTVHPIMPYRNDTVLLGGWYGGVQKAWIENQIIHHIPFPDQHGSDRRKHVIRRMSHYRDHQYWVGTYGNGLSVFDGVSGEFVAHYHYSPSDTKSLSSDFVNDVMVDRAGIVWVGTEAGLDKFDPFTQQFTSTSIPMYANEFSVYRTPGDILADPIDPDQLLIPVSGAGIYRYHTKQHTFHLLATRPMAADGYSDANIFCLHKDNKGSIWVGTRTGVFRTDEKLSAYSHIPLTKTAIEPAIHEILEDADGSFWFASYAHGLFHFDPSTGDCIQYLHQPEIRNSIPDNRVFCLEKEGEDVLWIGTQNRGLCRLEISTNTFTFFEHKKNTPNVIPDNGVFDLYLDQGHHLWIATENGLAKMDVSDFTIQHFTTLDGLCNNTVLSITPDPQGYFWLSTHNGFSRFDPAQVQFRNYYEQDGLPTNSLSGTTYLHSDGNLYIGTSGMLSYCTPSMMQTNRNPPPVVITRLSVFDQHIPVQRKGADLEEIVLSYRQNMITLEFAALNFTNTILNQYAYRLEGFDEQWIYCGNKQSATFTNLDGGTYRFHVKAANNDGVWNETGASVMITVKPPFWKTWWFYLTCFVAVTLSLYALYQFRIQQLLRLQQIRMRISRDLHDDIGSTLSSINMMSSMASHGTSDQVKSKDLFQTISRASHQAMELMNDIVWSINPKNDKLDMILIRMRQYASEMLEAAQIPFTISMQEQAAQLVLPIDKRKDFYLIFKEAINNLAKYSNAKSARIAILHHHRHIRLVIEDDGIGFDDTAGRTGNGIKNMNARASQLHGSLTIHTQPGKGTRIELDIPVTP